MLENSDVAVARPASSGSYKAPNPKLEIPKKLQAPRTCRLNRESFEPRQGKKNKGVENKGVGKGVGKGVAKGSEVGTQRGRK